MTIMYLLEQIKNKQIISEDNETLSIILNKGAGKDDIDEYERKLKTKLPDEFKELLCYSNGMDFYGLQIQSISEQEFIAGKSMISFHNWGNGDFDCVVVDSQQEKQYPVGQVVFYHYKTKCITPITGNLIVWFQRVYEELKNAGCLRHPEDYGVNTINTKKSIWRYFNKKYTESSTQLTQGLYANVQEAIDGYLKNTDQSKEDTRIEREFYRDGQISSEYIYINGRLHGITRHWYENGQLRCEIHFKNGKSHGPNIIWDSDGNIIAEGVFKDDNIWEGEFIFVDENGREYIEKYSKGKLISSRPRMKE